MFKKYIILIPLFISQLAFSQQSFQRIHLIKASQNNADNLEILNLFTNSAIYAYWVNKALNGSGTRSAVHPTIPESSTYQFLRILSLFDLYFNHSALALENAASGKKHFIYFSTLMSGQDIRSYPNFSLGWNNPLSSLVYGLVPIIRRQQFKSFTNRDILYFEDGPLFSQSFRNKIHDRLKEKMSLMWDRAFAIANSPDKAREIINGIILPLTALSDLHIDKSGESYYNASFYLPGLVNIDRKKANGELSKNPMDWKLEPGLELELNPPIKGMNQVINKISYLRDIPKEERVQAIKNNVLGISFSKNLRKQDEISMTIEFGQLPSKADLGRMLEKEDRGEKRLRTFPIDLRNRKGALKMEGYLNLAKGSLMNRYLNKFHLEAWIHKISFDLKRPNKYKSWRERFEKNPTLRLVNNIDKTIISVRLKKGANNNFHKTVLKMMGFTCKKGNKFMDQDNIPVLKNYKYTCVGDYSNSKEFKSKFFAKLGKPIVRKLIGTATHSEIKGQLKDLDKMATPDLQLENALAQEILNLLKNNQLIIEVLNLLPGGLSTLEGI